jgi:2-(1,2-epoxy-1,2-dihydrophenyl)acetyl-CoA isomerase
MDLETITYETVDGVAHVTLDRPDAGNAISLELARELEQVMAGCRYDTSVRAVLLTGAGRSFCVGGDLRAFAPYGDELPAHLREVTDHLHGATEHLARMDAPVIAAVQGSAAGAGMSLACASDIVLCARSAKFVMAYTAIGLSPDGGGSWFLPRLVGLRRAIDIALTNPAISAEQAVEYGIASRVVDDDALVDEARALATSLASGPTRAFGAAKRLVRDASTTALDAHLAREAAELAGNAARHDGQEGIAAFLAKRPPKFTGE